ESPLPVVSAVGHGIDITISGFVADVRALTPSAGAEIITEGVFSSCQFIDAANARLRKMARQRWHSCQQLAIQNARRLERMHPRRRFNDWLQRLDDLQTSLTRQVRQRTREHRAEWRALAERLSRVRPALVLK